MRNYKVRTDPKKGAIIRGKEKDLQKSNIKKSNTKLEIGILFILSCIFLIGSYISFENSKTILSTQDITTLRQIVTNEIKIDTPAKGGSSIKLSLKEYPNFDFQINGIAFSATNTSNLISNVKIGDTILVDIKTDEYKKKLTKEKPLGFFDKTLNYKFINIYGLRDKTKTYLTLSDYNAERKTEAPWVFWISLLTGLGFLTYTLYATIQLKKKPDA